MKRVLNVGQCVPDHAAIRSLIERRFGAQVVVASADNLNETLVGSCVEGAFDLVLVNRKLDVDYSDGMEIVRQLKADEQYAALPVMLVTNYPGLSAASRGRLPPCRARFRQSGTRFARHAGKASEVSERISRGND